MNSISKTIRAKSGLILPSLIAMSFGLFTNLNEARGQSNTGDTTHLETKPQSDYIDQVIVEMLAIGFDITSEIQDNSTFGQLILFYDNKKKLIDYFEKINKVYDLDGNSIPAYFEQFASSSHLKNPQVLKYGVIDTSTTTLNQAYQLINLMDLTDYHRFLQAKNLLSLAKTSLGVQSYKDREKYPQYNNYLRTVSDFLKKEEEDGTCFNEEQLSFYKRILAKQYIIK